MTTLRQDFVHQSNLQFPRLCYLRGEKRDLVLEYPDVDPQRMAGRFSELLDCKDLRLTIAPFIGLNRFQLILESIYGISILAIYPLNYREDALGFQKTQDEPSRIVFKSAFREFYSDLWIDQIC